MTKKTSPLRTGAPRPPMQRTAPGGSTPARNKRPATDKARR
jgi:hypothetical protein